MELEIDQDDPEYIFDFNKLEVKDFENFPMGKITLRDVTFRMRVGLNLLKPMQAVIACGKFIRMTPWKGQDVNLETLDPNNPDGCLYYDTYPNINTLSARLTWKPGVRIADYEDLLNMIKNQEAYRQAQVYPPYQGGNPGYGVGGSGGSTTTFPPSTHPGTWVSGSTGVAPLGSITSSTTTTIPTKCLGAPLPYPVK